MEIDSGQPNTNWAQCKDQIEIVFFLKKKKGIVKWMLCADSLVADSLDLYSN